MYGDHVTVKGWSNRGARSGHCEIIFTLKLRLKKSYPRDAADTIFEFEAPNINQFEHKKAKK
ncbi:hypothetical protein DRF67_09535 [Chryseobacterium pennipullorum]|uniref:Uncharacterized protein n=1 Tax=Chryseobacterium pennipullorum TaxID=2258963 RepID=A0A3D9B2Y8_9FLAO|nr:hypothetical protein DRF67_09535 [Chryseobacterium pennipullorum]